MPIASSSAIGTSTVALWYSCTLCHAMILRPSRRRTWRSILRSGLQIYASNTRWRNPHNKECSSAVQQRLVSTVHVLSVSIAIM